MSRRTLPVVLATTALVAAAVAPAVSAPSTSAEAQVRITGTLMRTSAEPGHPAQTAVVVAGRLAPVEASPLVDVPAGAIVTLDVEIPADVRGAAAARRDLVITLGRGRTRTHSLSNADLDDAVDGAPATAGSPIGRATRDAALASGPLTVSDVVSTQAAPAVSALSRTTRDITVVNVAPQGTPAAPVSSTRISAGVTETSAFLSDNSAGMLTARLAAIKPSYTSAFTCSAPWSMWQEAADRIGWSGIWQEVPKSLVLAVPEDSDGCSWGLASMGNSPQSGGYAYVQRIDSDVLTHEIGHNISLAHSNTLACATSSDAKHVETTTSGVTRIAWPSTCNEYPYGDGQDIMGPDLQGAPSGMLSTPQALRTGMLPATARQTVGTGITTVTLRPLAGRTGQRAAVVTNALTGVTYYVEYRTAAGRDAVNTYGQDTGVRVLRVSPLEGDTVLLDPTPTGGLPYVDKQVAVTPGRSVRSYDGKIIVRTISATSTQAVVEITNNAVPKPFTTVRTPTVSGSKGVGKTLTATPGATTPAATSFAYRWYRNGVPISGAYGQTYTPTTSDAGRYLTVNVTAQRSGYRDSTVVSGRVGIPTYNKTRPVITGTKKRGSTLTTSRGTWTPIPSTYAYQWYRGSTKITGATAKTYKLTSSDVGKKVRVKITARRTGYVTGTAYSLSTTTIAR